jgi:hypothetical protein
MSDITTEAKLKYIDLLIIDVEGHEYDVLETFDWDNVEVGVISIELLSNLDHYHYFKEKDTKCQNQKLMSSRYPMKKRVGLLHPLISHNFLVCQGCI